MLVSSKEKKNDKGMEAMHCQLLAQITLCQKTFGSINKHEHCLASKVLLHNLKLPTSRPPPPTT